MGVPEGLCGVGVRAIAALLADVAAFFWPSAARQHLAALLDGALPGGALLNGI